MKHHAFLRTAIIMKIVHHGDINQVMRADTFVFFASQVIGTKIITDKMAFGSIVQPFFITVFSVC